jgi:tetratricopeptide (TPR) repeat protein
MAAARAGDEEVRAELERANRWCDDACNKWYGEQRRRDEHYGQAIAAGQRRSPDASALLAKWLDKLPSEVPAIARATLLQTLSEVDPALAGKFATRLITDAHPLVRAAACDALPGNPTRGQAANLLANALDDDLRLVRTAAARNLLQFSPQEQPTSSGPKLRQAVSELVEGLKYDSDRAGAHLSLAVMAEQEGRQQTAIEHYRDAIRVEPGVTGARTNLAALLERNLNQPGSAPRDQANSPITQEIDQLRKAELNLLARDVSLLPQAAGLQYQYGLALYLNGQKEAALEHLTKAAQLEANNYQYIQALTLLLKSLMRWDEAADWCRKLLDLAPADDPGPQAIMREIEQRIP